MSHYADSGYDGPEEPLPHDAVVRAAQAGDQRALDTLVADYLPLVYNIVGRALHSPADTDDVVQEIMLQMIRDVRTLRDPGAFRSWIVAITMREVRRHWRTRRSAPATSGTEGLNDAAVLADPGADFVDLTITELNLSGQRQEVAEATRWLEPGDQQLLSLWWLEAAGRITRGELATAMELPLPQAAVRVQRMKAQLETARSVVRAISAVPRCPDLDLALRDWNGRPSGLWRKRVARHVRNCPVCGGLSTDAVPTERLLAGLALTPVPLVLTGLLASSTLSGTAGAPATVGQAGRAAGVVARGVHGARRASGPTRLWSGMALGKTVVVSSVAAAVLATGAVAYGTDAFGPNQHNAAHASARSRQPLEPAVTTSPAPAASSPAPAKPSPAPSPARASAPSKAPAPAVTSATLPVRAAFYYPWYPENFAGNGSHYTPSAGKYSVDDASTVDRQIKDMQYGGLQAGISSWWGRGKREDVRLPLLMTEGAKLGFSWTVYYEEEAYQNPSPATIASDLEYLRKYANQQTWLHINGKPVIFVYATGTDKCDMATRWAQGNKDEGYYVVLKVFGGYRNCADQPDGWHQYASSLDVQKGYSAIVSPGFWKNDAAQPVVPRDLTRFRSDATTVATSGEPFQLVVTYNEWGEGTAVESATDWPSSSGHGAYMDILHQVFGAHPS